MVTWHPVPGPQPQSLMDGPRWSSSSRHWYSGGDVRSGSHRREPCAEANSTGSGALGPQMSQCWSNSERVSETGGQREKH